MAKPILCLDFDGVIHSYTSGWKGPNIIPDDPVDGAFDFMLRAVDHFRVHIYSSRSMTPSGVLAMQEWMTEWATTKLGAEAGNRLCLSLIFAHEKPAAFLTIDDRALTFDGNWDKFDPEKLLQFKPWNK